MSQEDLISKKELLELTGISYGALYRWKRKNLIPDAWFIHRSAYTGQETYFPREKILQRVEAIQQMKDGMSLDDIAAAFQPGRATGIESDADALTASGIADAALIGQYAAQAEKQPPYGYADTLRLYLFGQIGRAAKLADAEAYEAAVLCEQNLNGYPEGCELLFVCRRGDRMPLLCVGNEKLCFPVDTRVERYHLSGWLRELDDKLKEVQT